MCPSGHIRSTKAGETHCARKRSRIRRKGARRAERAASITVAYPKGQPLPEPFVQQDWNAMPDERRHPYCLTSFLKCDAVLLDLDGDGAAEILLARSRLWDDKAVLVYKETRGKRTILGHLQNTTCPGAWDAVLEGRFELAAPALKEIRAEGTSLQPVLVNPGCRQAR
jgi:hypothetical protein